MRSGGAMRAPRTGGKGVIVLSAVRLRLRLVRDAAWVAAHRGGPREPDVVKRMSVPEVSLQELVESLSSFETSVVEKAACCSDKVSSLESSLSELDNKVLGALAVSSGELFTKLAGFQEMHQQLLADSQVGLRSELQSCRVELERVAESVVVSESRSKAAVTVQLEKLEGKLRASRRAAIESLVCPGRWVVLWLRHRWWKWYGFFRCGLFRSSLAFSTGLPGFRRVELVGVFPQVGFVKAPLIKLARNFSTPHHTPEEFSRSGVVIRSVSPLHFEAPVPFSRRHVRYALSVFCLGAGWRAVTIVVDCRSTPDCNVASVVFLLVLFSLGWRVYLPSTISSRARRMDCPLALRFPWSAPRSTASGIAWTSCAKVGGGSSGKKSRDAQDGVKGHISERIDLESKRCSSLMRISGCETLVSGT